jgi:acyl-CoA thioesterase-2
MPAVPAPEELPDETMMRNSMLPSMPDAVRRYFERERPIELRPVEFTRYVTGEPRPPVFHLWIRATGPLPDDPAIHQCVLAYASDMTLLDTTLIAHGRTVFQRDIQAASLDHALWFHAPFRADEWLLYAQDSPFSGGARGFARGSIFTRDGSLVASVAQEGLIRVRSPDKPAK